MKSTSELASRDEPTANLAAAKVLERGEEAIEELFQLEGDTRQFMGVLGHPLAAQATVRAGSKDKEQRFLREGRLVTVEVAALYLLEAIFHERSDFAQSPYLAAGIRDEASVGPSNSRDAIVAAWSAARRWNERRRKIGIAELRALDERPIQGSGYHFW